MPTATDRAGSTSSFSAALARSAAGFAGLPGGAWVWAVIAGLCTGAMFPLVMTLPVDIGKRPVDVGAVAGLMLGLGYSIGAIAPFLLGAVRDATGSFTATLWLIAGCRRRALRPVRLDDARADRARCDRARRAVKGAYRDGARAIAPIAVAAFAFALSFGVLARTAGMGWAAPLVMSATTFSGAAQFAVASILHDKGSALPRSSPRGC